MSKKPTPHRSVPEQNRIAVHVSLAHQVFGEQPVPFQHVRSVLLSEFDPEDENDGAYLHRIKVKAERDLPTGHVEDYGFIAVACLGPSVRQTNPEDEERKKRDAAHLILLVNGVKFVIRSGMPMMFECVERTEYANKITIQSSDPAVTMRAEIFVVPRK